jgi:hypothetical protein
MAKRETHRPPRDEADLQPGFEPGARLNRNTNDWLDAIGPEDMDPDQKVELLEEYGFDLQDQDERVDLPRDADAEGYMVDDGDDPEIVGDELRSTLLDAEDNAAIRPVEDAVFDDLDQD